MKFILLFVIITLFGCSSNKKELEVFKNEVIIKNILIKVPKSWKKDRKLKLWREKNSGAILNIETEESNLKLSNYMEQALRVIKKTYSYIEITRNSGKVGKFPFLNSIAEIEIDNRMMLVHTFIIDKGKFKITITLAVNKEKENKINDDFNYILKSFKIKR